MIIVSKKGLKTYCDDLIFDIKKENNKFLIKTKNREIEADIVVIVLDLGQIILQIFLICHLM